jgi:hypothetical protein
LNEFHPNELDPFLLFDARDSMIGTLENPTLDLDPSKPDTLNVITATRAGIATYTDVNGNIATASADTVRVDYTQGAELTPTKFQRVGYSTPDSNWVTVNSTLVENFEAAPDGTQSASKVTKLAVSGSGSSNDRVEYQTISITNGTTYSISVHLKNIDVTGFTTIAARVSGGSLFRVKFIWNTSALSSDSGTTSNRLVKDLGDGWYRVSFSFESNGTAADLEIDVDRSTGGREDTSSILVWGAQFEEGTTASDFVANTTGSPKFISSAVYSDKVAMVLIEPSAENLVTNSSSFSALSGATLISNIDAPDGSDDAKRVSNAQAINTTFAKSSTISIPTGVAADYVGSVYVRGTAGNTVNVFMKRASGGPFVTSGGRSVLLTGDWQRVENLALTSDPTNANLAIYASSAGETADLIDLWGGQIETGSVSTSVIPTSGSTVTRAADDLVISGSDFTNFFNSGGDGTFYAEFTTRTITGAQVYVLAGHTSAQRYMYSNPQDANFNSFDGAAPFISYGDIQTTLNRASVSYNATHKEGSLNGSTVSNVTSTGVLRDSTQLNIGQDWNSLFHLNGHIKRLIYWPYHSDSL